MEVNQIQNVINHIPREDRHSKMKIILTINRYSIRPRLVYKGIAGYYKRKQKYNMFGQLILNPE